MNQFLRHTFVLILFLWSSFSFAQEGNCAFKLQEAEAMYETGILDSIPALLRSCLNNGGFDDEELASAYKLLIKTYLFEDYEEMAELTMLKFLKKFPEYEIKATDPVEFTYLYKSYKTIPIYSIGIIGGLNYTFVRIIEPYTNESTGDYSGEYKVSGTKIQGGLQLKRYINEKIEINLDLLYTAKSFEYTIDLTNSLTTYTENQSVLSFPLTGTYEFNMGTWSPYFRLGLCADYLFVAKADFLKTYTGSFNSEDIKETDVDILENRNPLTFSAIVGGGLKYPIKGGYLMLDLRYQIGFMNNVVTENRYNDLNWGNYDYIDDDFTLNNLFVSIGYVFPFYQTKKNK